MKINNAFFTSTLFEHYARYEECGGLDYDPHDNPIRNWLRYRLRAGEVDADASPTAIEMYRALWGVESWKIADLGSMEVTGETMCSFWTTYKQALVLGAQEKLRELLGKSEVRWATRGFGLGILQNLFIHFDDEGFNEVHGNKELQRFAQLTHCLGNMIIVPRGFNSARNQLGVQEKDRTYDYWDLSLYHLLISKPPRHLEKYKDDFVALLRHFGIQRLGLEQWLNFADEKDSFLSMKETINFLPGHSLSQQLPQNWEQLQALVIAINDRIKGRAENLQAKFWAISTERQEK